jgi:hypothetical protein
MLLSRLRPRIEPLMTTFKIGYLVGSLAKASVSRKSLSSPEFLKSGL